MERTLGRCGLGVAHGLDNAGLQSLAEDLGTPVAVDLDRARGMVRVGGVDQHVGRRDAAGLLDLGNRRVGKIAVIMSTSQETIATGADPGFSTTNAVARSFPSCPLT